MVDQEFNLPTLNFDADQASSLISLFLQPLGFRVLSSFDLRAALASQPDCTCPHHGRQECSCQMVVLLVYGKGEQPSTLVLHGCDGKTFLSLVDSPQQRVEKGLMELLYKKLSEPGISK
jgi:hypothetical protein